jgi:nucleotide-binding universal stress UspA family protein
MYKTILVPVDLGHPAPARRTVQIARELGGSSGRVILLYVLPDIPAFVASELPEGTLERNLANARARLKAIAAEIGAEAEVRHGHPPTVILEAAEQAGADLIIIASHRPGLQDYFLGSTAARVVRHARCSVLVER